MLTNFQLALLQFTLRMTLGYAFVRLFHGLIIQIVFTFKKERWQKYGAFVEAVRVSYCDRLNYNDRNERNVGKYEYYVNGTRYTKRFGSKYKLPETTTLWYRRDPRAAAPTNYVGIEPGEKKVIALTVLIYALVFTLL